ncbi:MAG: MFS transporter [Nitrososphaeraceae archaeon]|jgi:MFS family permease
MNIQRPKHITSSPWITLAILSGLGIIVTSAETMVLPAIPDIIVDLDISYEDSAWILASLLVTGAVMTPIAGKLSDVYGKKKILLIILAAYILGLLLGATSTNYLSLVTARVMQGVGISMFPIAFSIIRDKFPPEKLAIAVGIFSSTLSGGAVIGLIIGGSIVESFGWRAAFLFMTPIAIILFAIIAKFVYVRELGQQQLVSNKASEFCCRFTHVRKDILLTENANTYASSNINDNTDSRQRLSKSIDIKGAITLSVAIISFLVTLQFLEKAGSNDLIQIIIFSGASIVSLFLFIAIEKKALSPLIDFKLLKNRIILPANIIGMTVGFTSLMVVYQTLPILIRSPPPVGFGGDASSIANVQLPYMTVSLIFSVASGFVVSKFGNLRPTIVGTIITSIGFFVLFMFHSTEASIAAVLVIVAVGLALMLIGSVNVVLTSTPKQFSGISLGMNLLIYLIGSSVGPVIAGIYLQANQVFVESEVDGISASFPSPESYNLIFLTAALISVSSIAFAIFLSRSLSNRNGGIKEIGIPT